MKHVRKPLRGKSYDEWFASHSPVTRVQFCGLILLGGMLMASGVTLLVVTWLKVSSESLDVFAIAVLSVLSIPSIAIAYFGFTHIKRALSGNR